MKKEQEKINVCSQCKEPMYIHEVDVLGMNYDVGYFCDNEKCPHYKILKI